MRRQAGFTLLEVIVAFTVLALVLAGVLQTVQSALRAAAAGSHQAGALQVAESAFERARADALQPGLRQRGSTGAFDWQLTIADHPTVVTAADPDDGPAPYALVIDVHWREGSRGRSLSLQSWQLLPTAATHRSRGETTP